MTRYFLLLVLAATLPSCSTVQVSDYQDRQPAFHAEHFFDGKLSAHGVVKDRSGKVTRTFTADILAYWQDGIGILEEDFIFDDGMEQRRVWTLTPDGQQRYTATAGDVIGPGVMNVAGNSAFLNYVLRIPYGDSTVDVRVDDRMYLLSDGVLLNESKLTKFGLHVGDLLLVIVRDPLHR